MSAFMVSKEHIDLLVSVIVQGPRGVSPRSFHAPYFNGSTVGPEMANDIGDMLVRENLSSIHSRYPDTIDRPEDTPGPIEQYWMTPYEYTEHHYRMTVVEALSAIACYEYQSCEHPEWDKSEARQYCESLRRSLVGCIPGYQDAPWEWTEETIQKHRAIAR